MARELLYGTVEPPSGTPSGREDDLNDATPRFVMIARNDALMGFHSFPVVESSRIQQTIAECLGQLSGLFHVWITPGIRERSAEIRIRQPHGLSSTLLVDTDIPESRLADRVINSLLVADPIGN